jgi:hypothetical protein
LTRDRELGFGGGHQWLGGAESSKHPDAHRGGQNQSGPQQDGILPEIAGRPPGKRGEAPGEGAEHADAALFRLLVA